MKTALKLIVAAALLVSYSSCKTFKDLSKQKDGDDVYFSMKDAKKERAAEKKKAEAEQKRKEEEAAQKQIQENNAKAMATSPGSDYYNEPFDYDDYYDYEYAARLRRFHSSAPSPNYYDNYYTNSYYYNQNPNYYGASVYNSYSFWGPSAYAYHYCPSAYFYYNSGWAWGTGMYYGNPYGYGGYYDPWANQGWGYNPYYSYYGGWNSGYCNYGYNPWGYGYNPYGYGNGYGYGNNYGNGNNNYYYNSYDENSDYYGPRHSPTSTDGRVAGSGGPAFGERYTQAIAEENGLQNASIEDINRVTRETFTATQVSTGGRDANGQGYVPSMQNTQQGNTNVGRDAAPANTQSGNTAVPPAPNYSNTTTPANTPTPPAPDFSRPGNTAQPAPSNTPSRDSGNSPSNSAPANSGGSNGGSRNSGGNSGGNNGGNVGGRPR